MRESLVFAGIILYLGFCMGLRSWLHRRATGQSGYLGISGKPGSQEWWAGVSFMLAVTLLAAAPAIPLPTVVKPSLPTDILGTLGVALGALGTWWSQSAMGSSWRVGVAESERTALVTSGPFARVRNPIFSSMLLAALGVCLLLPSPAMLAGGLLLLAAVELQVRRVEEPYLARIHGTAYRDYANRVGRFVPRV